MYIIVFTLLILLLVYLTIRLYRKNWSKKLEMDIRFGSDGVFEGEKGVILQTVTNKKLLPLWWGDLQFRVSNFIHFDDVKDSDHENYKKDAVSVLSYQMVKKTLPFTAARRGYYTIDNAELLTGDMFFQYKFIRSYPIFSELYVYPDMKSIRKFNVDFRKIVGDVIAKRHVIEDPFEFRGIRDYYPFDSLKTVNWNASAKTGDIKVNQYNYTSSQEVMLLLDMEGYNAFDKPAIKEDLIRIAAYLTRNLIQNGIPVGVMTNACDIVTGEELSIPCKNGSGQEKNIFRIYARIAEENISQPYVQILQDKVAPHAGPHYILISYYAGEALQTAVQNLISDGHSLQWLLLKDRARKINIINSKNLTICEADY